MKEPTRRKTREFVNIAALNKDWVNKLSVIESVELENMLIEFALKRPCGLHNLMEDIAEWADATFKEKRTVKSKLKHLQKESQEAIEACEVSGSISAMVELCDCFMLILDACSIYGMTADTLIGLSTAKLAQVKKREWAEPDNQNYTDIP